MEELIPIVNSLQDALASFSGDSSALDLPQIAVVGNQSAGKSSVLEHIVGRDFLPRGSGIVTRRPLVLQLVHANDPSSQDFGVFLHRKSEVFTDYEAIRAEIAAETARVAGSGKAVSAVPISLALHSPRFLDLTLVDLPGMTKVPVGDQPADIEAQVLGMLESFICKPNCLILAVCPANADLATSDALQLAQRLDPAGARTIGVLTKLDLMDEGTDAGAVLANEVIPLRLGFSAVVNRSQRDIDGRKDMGAALAAEAAFFARHPVYARDAFRGQCGTDNLRRALNIHLTRHIAGSLPGLRAELRRRLHRLQEELDGWTCDVDYADEGWRPKLALRLAVQFGDAFKEELLGTEDAHLDTTRLTAGARINVLFHRRFREAIARTEWTQEAVMKRQIGYAIENIKGVRTGMFTPDQAFDRIIREQIRHLREPMMEILEKVEAEVLKAVCRAADARGFAGHLGRFPRLAADLRRRLSDAVADFGFVTRERVRTLLDWEHAYINTKHEDFVTFQSAYDEASRRVRRRKNPAETVKWEGWLQINNFGAMRKKSFFVLTMESLSWYSDASKSERQYSVSLLDEVFLAEGRGGGRFALRGPEGRNLVRDKAVLELQAPSQEDLDQWKRCFLQVGVFPEDGRVDVGPGAAATTSGAILEGGADADLERQIESLWILVDSYMRIIAGTLADLVPKCVVRSLVKDAVDFAARDLVSGLARREGLQELMEEDETELRRKAELVAVRDGLASALERLSGLSLPQADLPPPLQQPRRHLANPAAAQPTRPPPPRPAAASKPASREASREPTKKTGKVAPIVREPNRKSSRDISKALRTLESAPTSQFY